MSYLVNVCLSALAIAQLAIGLESQGYFPEPQVNSFEVVLPTPTPVQIIPEPTATPEPAPSLTFIGSGYAAHYGKTVMDNVARNRGYAPQQCQISYTEATNADIGTWLYVESQLGFKDGIHGAWCQIMDMPQPYDYASIKGRGIIVELGWAITPYLCGITSVGQEPPRACPVRVYR